MAKIRQFRKSVLSSKKLAQKVYFEKYKKSVIKLKQTFDLVSIGNKSNVIKLKFEDKIQNDAHHFFGNKNENHFLRYEFKRVLRAMIRDELDFHGD